MKKAVIYARFSSHSQTEQSIEGQLRECYDFAKRSDITIVGEYIDRALTGTSDKRPQFLKMIEDSKKKNFEYVLVYQLDRFARNRYDSANYKAKLKKNEYAGAYLFYGDEAYMKDHYVSQLRKVVLEGPVPEFNYSVYEAEKLDVEKIAEEAYMLPLMADYKMIEIQAFSAASLTAAVSSSLADIISDLPEYFILLFTVRSGEDEEKAIEKKEPTPFVAAMKDYGNIVKFESESGNKLLAWMNRHFTALNFNA